MPGFRPDKRWRATAATAGGGHDDPPDSSDPDKLQDAERGTPTEELPEGMVPVRLEDLPIDEDELERLIDPDFLGQIHEATGFSYQLIDQVPPGLPQHVIGFTNMGSGRIFLVKRALACMLMQKQGDRQIRGFLLHEGGHHAPPVRALRDMLLRTVGETRMEPSGLEEYFSAPPRQLKPGETAPPPSQDPLEQKLGKRRAAFWRAVMSNPHNAAADVWLEEYTSRKPYDTDDSYGGDFRALYDSAVEGRDTREHYERMPLHMQFTQWIVGAEHWLRNYGGRRRLTRAARERALMKKAKEILDPEVFTIVTDLRRKGVFAALMDRSAWQGFSQSEAAQRAAVDKKFRAVTEYLVPKWAELFVLDFQRERDQAFEDEEEKQKGEEGQGEPQEGDGDGQGEPQEGDGQSQGKQGKGGKKGKSGKSQPGQPGQGEPQEGDGEGQGEPQEGDGEGQGEPKPGQKPGKPGDGLSDERKKEIAEQILDRMLGQAEQDGDDAYGPKVHDQGQAKKKGKKIQGVQQAGSGRGRGNQAPGQWKEAQERGALDNMRDEIRRAQAARRNERIGDLAGRFGVSAESVRFVERIQREYEREIQQLAEDIKESFASQRAPYIVKQQISGRISHGREGIAIAEARRGNLDVEIRERIEQMTEFLETEVEMLYDTSGSMSGQRLEFSQTMSIIIVTAFERVRQMLLDEGLLFPEEEDPLRTGHVLFTTVPERIKKLSEPTKPSTLAQMVEQTGKVSGGTDDAAAIAALTSEFAKGKDNVLKFLTIASDGEGSPAAVQNILDELEKDDEIIVIVIAMGANPSAVAQTYGSRARAADSTNVKIIDGNNVRAAIQELSKYLQLRIRRKSEELSGL